MNSALEVRLSGWTATPRMPFVLSGNAVCMPVPSYSLLLGMIGCCLGRLVQPEEVSFGFRYTFDTVGKDMETRRRLEFDGKKVKPHAKGTDAYVREFHVAPKLTLWLNQTDWETYFLSPVGTPSLGRSQDILSIDSVREVAVESVPEAKISGCMVPFSDDLKVGGQLVQLAEAYRESDEVGNGRIATKTGVFMAIHSDNEASVKMPHLYQTKEEASSSFYLHHFGQ